ncbi:MAG: hypothetical protein K8R02_02485 [Anaerohalosphaeraceae bacterium]|nr:hypothetical protein [Anaerohalosphaeraceae bacterium]
MSVSNLVRTILFIVFSSVGVLAMGVAMLAGELQDIEQMRTTIAEINSCNDQISRLISDHDELIANIKREPNMLRRIAPVVIGAKTSDTNEPAARIAEQKIARAKQILDENTANKNPQQCPAWLERCGEKHSRIIMFVAGAGLVATSFACFRRKN